MTLRFLIVEDDQAVSQRYAAVLEAAWGDVTVDCAYDEEAARAKLSGEPYDLITLDMALSPRGDRTEGARILKEGFALLVDMDRKRRSMVIVVSAYIDDNARSLLSTLRVFDILEKPHADSEYLRAVRLGLESQRKRDSSGPLIGKRTFGDLVIDPLEGPPIWRGRALPGCSLTQQRLLYALAKAEGAPVPLRKLGEALPSSNPTDDNIRVHISELRRHFSEKPSDTPIKSVTGVGYRWEP